MVGYMGNQLFGSFSKKMFRQCTITHFVLLIRAISLDLGDTNMRESVLVEATIDMVLARLGIENSLQMCGKV